MTSETTGKRVFFHPIALPALVRSNGQIAGRSPATTFWIAPNPGRDTPPSLLNISYLFSVG